MHKVFKVGALVAVGAVLCGFSGLGLESSLGVYRGEPVQEAMAKLGRPIGTAYVEHQRVYFWHANLIGVSCKVWGAAQRGIIVRWGYQACT
ncbi:MAG: hypothetical protein KGK33_09275 [Hyphomicrobiales bacterium]|jgi:hypothetical protein|nr:hypothetical protein [Hyphomicrobiales bacterium]MDE1973343.1 hypothetical protein [Hyphomicrobiales bacterium]MDE2284790.1 hypothetical protein [Hyphomicrobiales bacterium]MDE2372896.1 hypothetical protein [Hyphomicrobiales bacterium]